MVLVGPWCWGHCHQAGTSGIVIVVIVLVLVSDNDNVITLGDGAVLVLAVVIVMMLVGLLSLFCYPGDVGLMKPT